MARPTTLPADIVAASERVFGHGSLRPGQAEAVGAAASGKDAVVLLPTGGGKSLCYQLPAVVLRERGQGPTLVISPLIALMRDQVDALRGKGVRVAAVNSQQDALDNRAAMGDFMCGRLDMLYASPERAALSGFREAVKRANISLLAIDEAHCISQWGHDFRREYMRLHELKEQLAVPTIALTATATPKVLDEIVERLGMESPTVVRGSFARANLTFAVSPIASDHDRIEQLVRLLDAHNLRTPGRGRALVYCATRKKVEAVATALKQREFAVGYYHAGRSDLARSRAQTAYDMAKRPILVATNAFGMGVDSPDVRLLVHFQTPGSLEAYYQEAGRAGRDGAPATCHLFFGIQDLVTQRFLSQKAGASASIEARRQAQLRAMEDYARSEHCRQRVLCSHFTGDSDGATCGICDTCQEPAEVEQRWVAFEAPRAKRAAEAPVEALPELERELILQAAAALVRPVGKVTLAKALRGGRDKNVRRNGLTKLPQHGELSQRNEPSVVAAIEQLLRDGILEKRGVKYPTVWLKGRPVRGKRAASGSAGAAKSTRTRGSHTPLTRALDNYRRRMAKSLRWKPYMVFQRKVIKAIDEERPENLGALQQIHGMGPAKVERFGGDILEMVRRFS